jgi:parvulin-like peptidyl-prolyl isomerase
MEMRKPFAGCFILFLALIINLQGCGKKERKSRPQDALVCINQQCLTERDVEFHLQDTYTDSLSSAERDEFVREWIRGEILYQEALRQKLDEDERVSSLLREKTKQVLVEQFIKQKLKGKINVTEEDAKKHFRENRKMYVWEDDYVGLSHIFTKGMEAATRAQLLLKEGKKFEEVVKLTSEDLRTKTQGGDLGLVRVGDLTPEIAEHANKMRKGEISPLITTPYGYEIIKVTERRRKGTPMQFEHAKEEILNDLALQRRQKELEVLFKRAAERAKIETFNWASQINLDDIRQKR